MMKNTMTKIFKQSALVFGVSCALSAQADLAGKDPIKDWSPELNVWEYTYRLSEGDPLVAHQWHLQNTGQAAFSSSNGIPGFDLNLDFTHRMGIMGEGVNIAIIDDGVQARHPDLVENINDDLLKQFGYDTTPAFFFDYHGTSVAGIAAATAFNNEGGRGVAPRAGLTGVNILGNSGRLPLEIAIRAAVGDFSVNARNKLTDSRVFNQSFGRIVSTPFNINNPQFGREEALYQDITLNSHNGRGAIFVKSAGNGYDRTRFNNQELPAEVSNLDASDANYWNVVVSSMTANGTLAPYSTVGSNVMFTAPGGDGGETEPGIITTDLTGCSAGLNIYFLETDNALHGQSNIDPNCDYNAIMGGTSSAAPATSGAIALIMSANHALNWRDIRHIMIKTARKVDPQHSGIKLSPDDIRTYRAIPGWQTNSAGYDFHNFYGFGLIDVDAAVLMAMQHNRILPQLHISDFQSVKANNILIPDGVLSGASSVHRQTEELTVESVQIVVNVGHQRIEDLAFELFSPSMTRSVLLSPQTSIQGDGFTNTLMLSHQFYGEQAKGDWTLKVIDTSAAEYSRQGIENNKVQGVIKDWHIRFFGHK